ncbi:MAG: protein kinase domain-containing protein [Panacagrimonas sp.]
MAVASLLKPGDRLGKYEILRPLGKGGMAEVYEATDTQFGRKVALKVLPPTFAANEDAVERFHREVRQAAKLDHRSIVTVYDGGEDRGLLYFSMRLLRKGDLADRIERGMPALETLAVLREVTDALGHAHAAGLIHRDIKPANILFDDRGTPVVTDFGIAKAAVDAKMTRTGTLIGTPRYMSPEQFKGGDIDTRSDFYSLGAVAFEMLAGYTPYDAEQVWVLMNRHLNEPVPKLPANSARYQPLIERMMSKDPAGRPQTAAELLDLIDALLRNPDPQDRLLSDGQRRLPASSDGVAGEPLISPSGVGPLVDSVLRRAGLQPLTPPSRETPIGHDTPTLMNPVEPDATEVLNHRPTPTAGTRMARGRLLAVIALLGGAVVVTGAFVFLRWPTSPLVEMPTQREEPAPTAPPMDTAAERRVAERRADEPRKQQADAAAKNAERAREEKDFATQKAEEERKRLAGEAALAREAEQARTRQEQATIAKKALGEEQERKRQEAAATLKAEDERKEQAAAAAAQKADDERKRLADEAALAREAEQVRNRQEQAAIAKKAQDEEQERKRQTDAIAAQKAEEERKRAERMNRPMF